MVNLSYFNGVYIVFTSDLFPCYNKGTSRLGLTISLARNSFSRIVLVKLEILDALLANSAKILSVFCAFTTVLTKKNWRLEIHFLTLQRISNGVGTRRKPCTAFQKASGFTRFFICTSYVSCHFGHSNG